MSISLPKVTPAAEQAAGVTPITPCAARWAVVRGAGRSVRQHPTFLNQTRQAVGDIYTLALGVFKVIISMLNHPNCNWPVNSCRNNWPRR